MVVLALPRGAAAVGGVSVECAAQIRGTLEGCRGFNTRVALGVKSILTLHPLMPFRFASPALYHRGVPWCAAPVININPCGVLSSEEM